MISLLEFKINHLGGCNTGLIVSAVGRCLGAVERLRLILEEVLKRSLHLIVRMETSGTLEQAPNNDEVETKTIVLPYPPCSPVTPEYFLNWHVAFRIVSSNLQTKLKVHRRLNERTWLEMDSKNVWMTFTSNCKSVLLSRGLISNEGVFKQFNW
ncbi:hypothetical protein TNCV_4638631 [Trichonephila clavipes]|uniref:Uncharacterized protein n=1 Tax=Trichonephila clavipes TaxID=2585209 RepID=A0A8X6WDV5_TRICX|nr:hypothetical protein TNCV_4638631 [Trichonephila clavipes]